MYDLSEIKTTASGRWLEIVQQLGSVDRSILDGQHHPCPKCGGHDRFRMIDRDAGSLFCNKCFSAKNGDGIAAVKWLLACDFKTALSKIAEYLGIKPVKKKRIADPADHLKFKDWNEALAGLWCLKKKPIKPDAFTKLGARMAIYRGQHKVVALPVWRSAPDNVVGWCIFNVNGGTLPKFKPTGEIEQVKVKLTFGSKPGLIGWIDSDATKIYKTEGPTDLLALSQILDSTSCGICNANGAKENPARSFGWLPSLIDGKEIRVIHDADEPGQDGATWVKSGQDDCRPGWATWLATQCEKSTVKNLLLPYSVEPAHGKDIRDWISDGGTADLLEELAEVDPVQPTDGDEVNDIWEADDDPHRLANVNLKGYKKITGGTLAFYRDEWWKYKSGRYQKIQTSELKAKVGLLIRREFERLWLDQEDSEQPVKKVTIGLVANVVNAMATLCTIPSSTKMPCWLPDRKPRNYLAFQNGILDLDAVFSGGDLNDCLLEHTPNWFSSFRLDYQFDPDANCPKWLQYLEEAMESDDDRIELLQEWAGYLLTNKNEFQKFLVLEGEGKNGKTVFFAGMTAMLGEGNVSHVAMENFGGRFDLGVTLGKAANISGDVGEIDNMAEGILKQFTGGDTMQFDRKNLLPVQARPTAKLMAAWNQRPRIKDRSEGLWRRMLLVPFRYSVPDEKRVYGMDQPDFWAQEAAGILMWALCGLDRLKKNRKFTKCQITEDAMDEYKLDSNPTAEFLGEHLEENSGASIDSKHLFKLYQMWCKEVNCRPLGARQFGKEIRRQFPNVDRQKRQNSGQRRYYYYNICYRVTEICGESVSPDSLF